MKTLLVLSFLMSVSAHASVYCINEENKKLDVLKSELECQGPLLMGEGVCFTGSRSKAIEILNSEELREIFDGTDGEFIGATHFNGRDAISYTSFDQANEVSSKVVINRCK